MHDLARRSIEKLDEAWRLGGQLVEMAERMEELRRRRSMLYNDATALRTAVQILMVDGEATEKDDEVLRRAFIAWEEGGKSPAAAAAEAGPQLMDDPRDPPEGGEMGPLPVMTEPPPKGDSDDQPKVRLLNAVDMATQALQGEFNSGDVRVQMERLFPAILKRVHRASIAGTLAQLVEVGRLERLTPSGRGREGRFRRKESADLPPLPPERVRHSLDLSAFEDGEEVRDGSAE